MKKPALRLAAVLAWAAGAGIFVWVLSGVDLGALIGAVRALGWGVAGVVAFHAAPLFLDVEAWRLLFAKPLPARGWVWWGRWLGESGNALLPGQAGELIRIRAAMLAGVGGSAATGSVVVDLTLGVMTQIAFSLVGLAVFGGRVGVEGFLGPLVLGIAALAAGVASFIFMQHRGVFARMAPLVAPFLGKAHSTAAAIDATVAALWSRPRTLALSAFYRLASCFVGAGEIWLVFWLLGNPIGFADAVALESLGQAARAAAFAIPAGLGVQEGALVLVAGALGLPPEQALAVALVKRARDLSLGVPGLLSWQALEFWRRRSAPSAS